MQRIGKTLKRAIHGAGVGGEMIVDILLTDCHSKRTFRPKLSSVCFEGRTRVMFFQIYMTRKIIYSKLFLVNYNKLLLFNKRYTTFKRHANKTYSQ